MRWKPKDSVLRKRGECSKCTAERLACIHWGQGDASRVPSQGPIQRAERFACTFWGQAGAVEGCEGAHWGKSLESVQTIFVCTLLGEDGAVEQCEAVF